MRPGARLKAAVEVLDEIQAHHLPAATALSEWGRSHRFAGSSDRAGIGNMVYDALRHKASAAFRMGESTSRALLLGALRERGLNTEALSSLCSGGQHELPPLSESELCRLDAPVDSAPAHIAGNFPEWLTASLERVFGARLIAECEALAARAPVDIRVNTLKADRDKVMKVLASHHPQATPWSPVGVRFPPPRGDARQANVEAEAAHGKGWYEIQDEGSQLAAALAAAGAQQVLDICAGAGGKTLAVAATLHNTGQIFAYDSDKTRLRPIFDRLRRAGVRNVQVLNAADKAKLDGLGARFDAVLIDAPCTGTGTWRRRPDAKWRLKPANLVDRCEEQRKVLALASTHVRPGGRLIYVTCSLLPEENIDQVRAFVSAHPEFSILPWKQVWREALPQSSPPTSADGSDETLMLTPHSHGTDGFFIAILARRSP
jgi:16S rRNA (cytosine967-C5)-methyltransferase